MRIRAIRGIAALDLWFGAVAFAAGVGAEGMLTLPATEIVSRIRRRYAS